MGSWHHPAVEVRSNGPRPLAALALLCLLVARTSFAQPGPSEADVAAGKEHNEEGQRAFEAEHFGEAARHFEQAWDLGRRPRYLWSASLAHRRQYEANHDIGELRASRLECEQFVLATDNPVDRATAMRDLPSIDEELKRAEAAAAPPAKPIIPSAALAPPPASPTKEPGKTRRWIWPVIAGAVVVAAGVGVGVGLGTRSTIPESESGNFRVFQ